MVDTIGVSVTDRGPQKQVYSGRMVHILDMRPEDVTLEDIAHHLALTNRWTGASVLPISVAQHSVLVSEVVALYEPHRPLAQLHGLLHDAHEAYLGDISRPVKVALECAAPGFFDRLAHPINAVVLEALAFGVPFPCPATQALIKRADNIVLATEARDLMRRCDGEDWRLHLPTPMPERIDPWSWQEAEHAFLQAFDRLSVRIREAE